MPEKPILHLNLHRKWFDIIGDPKKEEYRKQSSHWDKVFKNGAIHLKGNVYLPSEINICFSNGYAKDRPQKTFELVDLAVDTGNPDWGAEFGEIYHVLKLGQKVN